MKKDLIKVIAYASHGAEQGFDDAERVTGALRLDDRYIATRMAAAGFRRDAADTDDPSGPDTAKARRADVGCKRFFREPRGERRVHIHVRRNDGALKQARAENTKKDRAADPAINASLISIALRAAESWAQLTGWGPSAPDAYWRSDA